mmetsp:Transcript_24732/g.57177  ORF Transcript_24732/g.57177 Transcript_24732/m.57177 type:complete len:272 (+) Transcript_24732:1447-2262(+)
MGTRTVSCAEMAGMRTAGVHRLRWQLLRGATSAHRARVRTAGSTGRLRRQISSRSPTPRAPRPGQQSLQWPCVRTCLPPRSSPQGWRTGVEGRCCCSPGRWSRWASCSPSCGRGSCPPSTHSTPSPPPSPPPPPSLPPPPPPPDLRARTAATATASADSQRGQSAQIARSRQSRVDRHLLSAKHSGGSSRRSEQRCASRCTLPTPCTLPDSSTLLPDSCILPDSSTLHLDSWTFLAVSPGDLRLLPRPHPPHSLPPQEQPGRPREGVACPP